VKTTYDGDERKVLVLDDKGTFERVQMQTLPGQSFHDREDYPDITKYWRDHHVPEYSIERLKPCVLRDAYVPEYSRLSARAQAWRGFTKPKPSLLRRLSSSLSSNHCPSLSSKRYSTRSTSSFSGNGGGRSFRKYRNRQRAYRFSERTKINLAAFLPPTFDSEDSTPETVDQTTLDDPIDRLHAVIIENLPQGYSEVDVHVSAPLSHQLHCISAEVVDL
jgi:hypothetical protein